jgi:hypothetical protein
LRIGGLVAFSTLLAFLDGALAAAAFFLAGGLTALVFPRAVLALLGETDCFTGLEAFFGSALAVDLRATTALCVFDFVAFRWLPAFVTMQYTHPFEFIKLYFISNVRTFYKTLHVYSFVVNLLISYWSSLILTPSLPKYRMSIPNINRGNREI